MNTSPVGFDGLHVAAFESRREAEMSGLIQHHGGVPWVSPAVRETPLADQRPAIDFAHRLLVGEVGVVVFLTGGGFRRLLEIAQRHVDRQRYLDALADITTLARGPKVVVAMEQVGLLPSHQVAAPCTWREVLQTMDQRLSIAGQTVAIQEYGSVNVSLIAGLEARGAQVMRVPVYRWALPKDAGSLRANVRAVVAGQRDVLLFTSAIQVRHVDQVVRTLGLATAWQERLREVVVISIGPATSDGLREFGWPVDWQAKPHELESLVAQAAEQSGTLRTRKRRLSLAVRPPEEPSTERRAAWYDGPFMKACRREACDVVPVWLMRQAGRYMAEYRAVREKTTFLELCKNPALCSEVMCTAVRRLGVDAAIIFSDLLPILEPMGLDLEFAQGEGPVIHNPIRHSDQVDRVRELESVEALEFVMETVRQTRRDLPEHLPLIGFAGAPFTLASYAIEGGSSRNYLHTKTLMYRDPGAWRALMERFSRAIGRYLRAQIAAGAQCVQLFDSWAGCLNPDDYRQFVLPYVQAIVADMPAGVPLINFATGNPALLPLLAAAGSDVVGVDWRVGLDAAWSEIGYDRAVQGNLDPCVLLAEPGEIRRRARQVLDQAAGRPGHIFNLGHGVLPQTPVEHAIALVDAVHELGPSRPESEKESC